jgi:adenylate cyclase
MADLLARGPEPQHQWRRTLPAEPVSLGRVAPASSWNTPWDHQVSSLHAVLTWRDGRLLVRRAPRSVNPIFFQGQDQGFAEFAVSPGEMFVIGETSFTIEDAAAPGPGGAKQAPAEPDSPQPDLEMTCSRGELRAVKYADANERIEVLAALPEVIRFSPGDADLESRVVDVLLRGIPRAEAAAIVRLKPVVSGEPELEVRAAVGQDRGPAPLEPSRRLVLDAVRRRRQSVFYRWDVKVPRPEYTVHKAYDWAICAPLPDDPSPGWGLYVAGRLTSLPSPPGGEGPGVREVNAPTQEDLLKSDLKFAEVVADIFGSLRQVRDLQRRQTQLMSILSRPVVAALAQEDTDRVLQARETEVTVLFCDLRGSCRIMDEGQGDLPGLWSRVSEALSIMTSSIIDQDGVIGDFQGDAAMGFWGWPLDVHDQVERAAHAALNIRRRFVRAAQQKDHPLAGFACGIGIAQGPAIAGKLGTQDQIKVGVFGPVVNLASRLESMTKQFQVPILLDERCAKRLSAGVNSHWCRCRRLARVQPLGMLTVLTVSELLPPAVELGTLPERDRLNYEAALDAFLTGRWQDVPALLRRLPRDGPGERLQSFLERHGNTPPAEWDGVIVLESK